MDDEASHNCKNISAITSTDEDLPLVYNKNMYALNNESSTASNFYEMLIDVYCNAGDQVLMSSAAGPFGSSSMLDDLFQTSESLSNLPLYDNHAQQQLQGVNDNPDDWMNDIPTSTLYQYDHYLPDLNVDRQVPRNCERRDPADANQDLRKMIQHDADDHKEEFRHLSTCEPLENEERSFPFPQDVCGNEEHLSKQDMDGHNMQTHTGKKRFKRSKCGYKTSSNENLNEYMQTRAREKPVFKRKICTVETPRKRNLKKRTKIHTGEKPFKYNICIDETLQKRNLSKHMPKQVGAKPLKCAVCTYETSNSSNLKRHMLFHTGEKPFKCDVCNYGTSRRYSLSLHMLRHTGEKPFKCKVCDYESSQKVHLSRHMKIHTGEKPSKCDICSIEASDILDLKRHMLVHTAKKSFRCEVCDYETSWKGNLNKHMQIHSEEKPYKCK